VQSLGGKSQGSGEKDAATPLATRHCPRISGTMRSRKSVRNAASVCGLRASCALTLIVLFQHTGGDVHVQPLDWLNHTALPLKNPEMSLPLRRTDIRIWHSKHCNQISKTFISGPIDQTIPFQRGRASCGRVDTTNEGGDRSTVVVASV
jgi:hypothetical protein